MKTLLVAVLTLSAAGAQAQSTGSAPNPNPVEQAQPETPPADAATTAPPAEPSTEERVTSAEGKVSAIEEQLIELKSDVSGLKKLKFGGYVQARYSNLAGDDALGTPGESNFFVRRGRLKGTYTADLAQFVLQVDATGSGVSLKDAEATLFLPGTRKAWALTAGQMKLPFSYEVNQSSSDREFPERSRVVRAFAAGERDRGLRISGKPGVFRLAAGVFNGNGTEYRTGAGGVRTSSSASGDNDKEKDVIGRAGFDLGWLSGGVSGWWGQTRRLAGTVNDAPVAGGYFDRTRVGADVQAYFDVLPLGGTAVKAEYITGKTYLSGGQELFDVSAAGWYLLLVQNVGLNTLVAARYDTFDPNTDLDNAASAGSNGVLRNAGTNSVGTLGLLASHYLGGNYKVTAAYEIPMTGTANGSEDPSDNQFTLQLQAKF